MKKNIFKRTNKIKMSGNNMEDMTEKMNMFMREAERNIKAAMRAGEELDVLNKRLLMELENRSTKNNMVYTIKIKEI